MKRIGILLLVLILVLGLTACGKTAQKDIDLNTVYESYTGLMPEMLVLDDNSRLDLLGIEASDCLQVITSICAVGMGADEVWLIRAKDTDALNRIVELAQNRLRAKTAETENYVPDQYKIVQQAKTITNGNYFALLVSPEVDSMAAAFENALKQ